jgi:hypothetical protein
MKRLVPLALATIATVACAAQGSIDDGAPGTGPGSGADSSVSSDAPGSSDAPPAGACVGCITEKDCPAGDLCAQFGGDIYCAPSCVKDTDCTSDRACTSVTDYTGKQVSVCVPRGDVCGGSPTPTGDAGTSSDTASGGVDTAPTPVDSGSSEHCGTLVGPDVAAGCTCTTGHTCAANGCYGGWWCDTATNKCHAAPAPSTCGGSTGTDSGTPPPVDAGPPPTGTVGPSGGSMSSLYFAVVGDTRPPTDDDTSGYPSAIIGQIYGNIAATSPLPGFVVSTGDYMFAAASGSQSGPQLDLYLAARGKYSGVEFPAMGNHECTGSPTSNCGPSGTDGVTNNYSSFLSKMLAPIGQTKPYYSIRVDATDGSWTSKLVFIAANAWDSAQSSWLDSALAVPTTYTFIVRHESSELASTIGGVGSSDSIIAKYPFTLKIVGHTHLYERHTSYKEVVIGNGGAPLTGTSNYGYAIFQQRSDGTVRVDMHDYATKAIDSSFAFAVHADGSAATP